jgi:hypothetical protein
MLEHGGLYLIAHANESRNEDSFLYGPDLIGAIHKKIDLMMDHWLDGQRYMVPLDTLSK